jgi:hypothetical protein
MSGDVFRCFAVHGAIANTQRNVLPVNQRSDLFNRISLKHNVQREGEFA